MSAVDDDVTSGLLQRKYARHRCVAYRRKVVAANSSELDGQQNDDRQDQGPGHEQVWQKVQQCLGSSQARQYTVSSVARRGELTVEHDTYLHKLSDDFVLDMKELITQNAAKMQPSTSMKQLVREVLHHTTLAKEILGSDSDSGRYSELFQRLQSYIKDPWQSCHPFVIYGPRGSDTSRVMSAVAAAVSNWLSTSGLVTVLRFIGTTSDSADVQTCVASVRAQIQAACSMEVSPPCDSLHCELTTFRAVLEDVSRTTAHTEPLLILLDGMEGLQPQRTALEALWTVRHLPANIYVIMSVSGSGRQNTGSVNVLQALLTLVGEPDLTFNVGCCQHDVNAMQTDAGRHLTKALVPPTLPSPVEVLLSTLDTVEADYGPPLVKYFASYVAVMNVGILDSEMFDLLVTNDEVMAERDRVLFSPGIVSILRQRLAEFLACRLVYGCVGFSWSQLEYRQAVAERYHVIVDAAALQAQFFDESTSFTLTLHRHVVQIYQELTRKSSLLEDDASFEEDFDNVDDARVTVQSLGPQNPIKANRLFHHLRVLLPADGLDRMKWCVLFNVDWLMSRLATSPVFQIINDVLSICRLCQDMQQQQVITIDTFEDVAILCEFLQLSSKALSVNHLSLPAEVITRFGCSSLVNKYQSVADLVSKSRRWLTDTESSVLVPLWSVWDHPGGIWRHSLDGVLHVVGPVDGEDELVGYGRRSVSIWNIQTGLMVHNFEVRPEQPLSGVLAAHDGAYVMTSYYSQMTRTTELVVLSTETGLTLLTVNLPHQLEVVALSKDDQLFVVSSLSSADAADSGCESRRSIVGIHITSRDVLFQLPVLDVHSEGNNNHTFSLLFSVCLIRPVCLSVCLSVYMSVCLYLRVCLSVSLSVCVWVLAILL